VTRARTPGRGAPPVTEDAARVVVVGAGPHALTVTAELVVDGLVAPDDVVVLDPTGRWLAHWEASFRRLGITHLRSPVVHHPHPDVDAILRRADLRDGDITTGPVPVPSQRIFMAVVRDLVDELELVERVRPTSAVALRPCGSTAVRVECDDGTTVRADHVVLATNSAVPVAVEGVGARVVPELPETCPGERLVVVGGGLTAAQLVRCALSSEVELTMVTRRPIVERMFDVDPGWMGPKFLAGFSVLDSPGERLAAARSARDGGSMPAEDAEWLRELVASGGVELREGVPAVGVERRGNELLVHLADDGELRADHVVTATGSRYTAFDDPLLGAFAARGHLGVLDGVPLLDPALRVPGTSIHAVGRAATIELGPAAGNLSGARRAARRIAAHLAGVDPVRADPGISNQPVVPSRSGRLATASGRSWLG